MICFAFMGLSTAYMVMIILEAFLLCTPVALNWDNFVPGTCGNQPTAYLAAGIINLLVDIGIIILPMPLLWNLQMPVARKLGISAMFGIGAMYDLVSLFVIQGLTFCTASAFSQFFVSIQCNYSTLLTLRTLVRSLHSGR